MAEAVRTRTARDRSFILEQQIVRGAKIIAVALIAVTGGIAEGKSTVLGYMASAGVSTLSSDAVAREVFEEPEVQRELSRLINSEKVDRDALRARIAEEPHLRREVNRLMHPFVWKKIRNSKAVAVEIPLLLEACLQGEFARVWIVTCGPEEQLRRLARRLGSEDQAKKLIASQLPTQAKLVFGDRIVRTNEPPTGVCHRVVEMIRHELDEQLVQVRSS
jgi:dephospho-CoA kinase